MGGKSSKILYGILWTAYRGIRAKCSCKHSCEIRADITAGGAATGGASPATCTGGASIVTALIDATASAAGHWIAGELCGSSSPDPSSGSSQPDRRADSVPASTPATGPGLSTRTRSPSIRANRETERGGGMGDTIPNVPKHGMPEGYRFRTGARQFTGRSVSVFTDETPGGTSVQGSGRHGRQRTNNGTCSDTSDVDSPPG